MKLKLLFFMGILSVLFNTMNGQNTAPVFQVPPLNRIDCPGYVAANIQYQVTDLNTPAPLLVVDATFTKTDLLGNPGGPDVTFTYSQDPTGILRAINVTPDSVTSGIVTVTLTVSDVGAPTPNLSTSTTFTVTFEDVTDPIISTTLPLPNIVENISATAGCEFTVPDYTSLISATDYCGGVVLTQSPAAGTVLSVAHNDIQTITITVTDDYGNDVSTSFDVTLEDTTLPAISAVSDFDVDINSINCDFTIPDYTGLVTTSDNCGTVTVTQSPVGTTISNHNTTQLITLTADDGNGNTADSTFTITLKDTTDPIFTSSPVDSNVNVDPLDCTFTIPDYTGLATATDNCGTATITQSPAIGAIVSGHSTTQLVTLTADDGNGNTTDATFTITLQDVTDPTISTVADFDVDINSTNCDFTIPDYTALVTTSDNCGTVTVTQSPIGTTISNHNTTQLITLTADDGNGNDVTTTFTITLKDVTDPTISTNGDFEVDNDPGQCGALVAVSATASDNCTSPITPTGVRSDALPLGDPFPVGTTTITWTATDAALNVFTTTQTIIVNDVEAPTFPGAPFANLVVNNDPGECTYETSQLPVPAVFDNCLPFSGIVTVSPEFINVSAGPDHLPSVVTWTAEDNFGNIVTETQNVTVQDLELPVMRTKNIVRYFDANGQIVITPADVDNGSTDNSTSGSSVDTNGNDCFTKYVVDNVLDCNEKGDNSVNLHGQDLYGNQHFQGATVRALDNTPPTFVDGTLPDLEFNTNSGCEWVGVLPTPATADNCSVKSVTYSPSGPFLAGTTTVVTWTVTDTAETTLVGDIDGVLAGVHPANTTTITQNVIVTDAEKPVAIAQLGVVVELDSNGDASISPIEIDGGSTDNCGIDTMSVSPNVFDCDNVGANVVTLTVTDTNGNISEIDTVVTVVDNLVPVIASVTPITVDNSPGICAANIAIVAPLADDNCTDGSAVGTRSDGRPLTDVYPLGNTIITWNFSDASGNAATPVTQTVDVTDAQKPTISVTTLNVTTNSGCIWTGTLGMPVTADNCSVASVTSNRAADFAYPIGATNVVWTVTDAAGNSEQAIQIVNVTDAEFPIAKASDFPITLNASGTATITVAQVDNGSTDNCGIASTTISPSSFTCANVGANTVVLTVTDNSGNISTANAIVTVVDDILPVVTANDLDIVVNTNSGCSATALSVNASATATDNCTVGTPVGTRSDAKALTADYPLGRTIITWNVTDENGNIALSVIQTVDVTDNQIPVITTNGNKTAFADLGGCSAVVSVSATAADNCGVGSPTWVRSDAKPLSAAYPVGVTTITWNVTDVNGNAAVAVIQTVTITDTQLPVITANGNKNFVSDFGQCGAIVAVSATATDNCSVTNPVVGTRSDAAAINALYPVGTTTITWNVTDVNGNAATPVTQTVIVRDLQIPVINGTVVSIDANTDANACGATVTVTAPTATDNCSVTAPVVGTRSDNLALTALYPIGTTTITWRVSDIYGNVAVPTTTTVKVKDATLPTVRTRNIPVQLNVGGFATIVPAQVNDGSTDNCGIASYSLDKVSFNCSNVGPNTVTLTVIDIHGNENSAIATVTISEPVKPIARALTSVTLQLNSSGTASVVPADLNNGSTDNCAIFSYALSKSSFNCSDVGTNIVNLTATDTSGNVSDPVQVTIIVEDKIVPTVITRTHTAILNAAGTVTINPSDVNNGSTDNCTIKQLSISKDTFTCANVGENVITLTVTDVNGNVGQEFAKVIVVDDIAPVVLTRNISLVLDGDSVSINPEDVLVSATDACGVDVLSYRLSQDTFTIVDVLASPVTITVYATDVNGNEGSATALVTFPVDPTDVVEAITPNGDGINDTWVISNITNHPNSVVRVFNRWGSPVYSAKNYQNDWDGKVNGSDATLPDGHAYFYQVDIDGDGKIDSQGWLYITRQ